MSSLPLHPAIVHLPLALALLIPPLALAALLLRARLRGAWGLVFAAQLLLAASAWAAVETGEHDEERAERFAPESAIERHEERAEIFLLTSAGMVLLMGAVAATRDRRAVLGGIATAASAANLALALSVGQAGGELVYVHGAAQAHVPADAPLSLNLSARSWGDDDDEDEDDDD